RAEERIARQNAELSVLTDRLARIHHFRERLLAELSHDLRAPLQIVLTRAERLRRHRRGGDVDDETQGIRLAALDALEQVDAMLEQVRSDHGEARLSLVDDDLAAVVRSVADQFETLATERQLTLAVETPDELISRLAAARRTRYVKEHLAAELAGNAPPPLEELDLPSVLLVDRDADRAAAMADALETRAGVFTAAEATEALRLATDLQPDMVVIGDLNGDSTPTALLDRMAREWRLGGVLRVAIVQR